MAVVAVALVLVKLVELVVLLGAELVVVVILQLRVVVALVEILLEILLHQPLMVRMLGGVELKIVF